MAPLNLQRVVVDRIDDGSRGHAGYSIGWMCDGVQFILTTGDEKQAEKILCKLGQVTEIDVSKGIDSIVVRQDACIFTEVARYEEKGA